jgi:hypothetical protein
LDFFEAAAVEVDKTTGLGSPFLGDVWALGSVLRNPFREVIADPFYVFAFLRAVWFGPVARDGDGGNVVRRVTATVAPGGAEVTVLDLNGFAITLSCPGGSVALRGNNTSGEAAQIEFRGFGEGGGAFGDGFGSFAPTTNANLNNSEDRGAGTAQFIRANGTGVTASYGWREDALGSAVGCRVFGEAVSG